MVVITLDLKFSCAKVDIIRYLNVLDLSQSGLLNSLAYLPD